MNVAALNQLPVNMHDLEEEGNANGFVCLSVCVSDKIVFIDLFSDLRKWFIKIGWSKKVRKTGVKCVPYTTQIAQPTDLNPHHKVSFHT